MARELKAADELENSFVDERVRILLPKFEALAPYGRKQREDGVKSEKLEGWKQLATREASILRANYDKPQTCLRQITALKKELKLSAKKEVKDHANYHPVNTIITHFGNALSFLFSEYTLEKNEKYREKVDTRSKPENRIELDLSPFIKEAHQVLSQVFNGATKEDIEWRDVSCALALVTGRRMGEVHLSGEFKKVDDYQVAFKGQLKGKSRKVRVDDKKLALRDYEFTIPTLVKADYVITGVQWLEENGKRFERDEDPERVNRRWSKVLSEKVRDDWRLFDEMTYHKFRGAYFRACVQNAKVDPYDWEDYAKQVLGDDDSATIKAYKRFVIKPGSITRV
jgi:hypothetical protein